MWTAVSNQAGGHPSPNAGVVEAAFAAALGVRVGGANVYAGRPESRPRLGTGSSARQPATSPGPSGSAARSAAAVAVLGLAGSRRWWRR